VRAAGAARMTRHARAARQMAVQDPPAFHIFYATGWRDAVLRVRTLDADGAPQTPVRGAAGSVLDSWLCRDPMLRGTGGRGSADIAEACVSACFALPLHACRARALGSSQAACGAWARRGPLAPIRHVSCALVRRRVTAPLPGAQGWREVPMFTAPSRAAPLGGAWLSAVVPATGDPARGPPQLEFTVADGAPHALTASGCPALLGSRMLA